MKRKLLVTILGLTAATAAFGQGHVIVSNYLVPPYNQVYYANLLSPPPGPSQPAVNDSSVILTLWYGEGNIADPNVLLQGGSFTVNPAYNFDPGHGHGPGGFYLSPALVLATWQTGDTFTFQVRASGTSPFGPIDTALSRSVLWNESAAIVSAANPANANTFSAGVPVYIVPEPSSLMMIGLGLGSFVLYRRRCSSSEE